MNGKDLDDLIDKMGTLVSNQNERATKLGQNELSCDYSHVGP
jgi:hypothetical protein